VAPTPEVPEWVGLEGRLRVVRIPYRARYADRLVRAMEPARVVRPVRGFAWMVCKLACHLCVVAGSDYTIVARRSRVKDVLSDLRHRIVSEVRGVVDGRQVWAAVWRGDMLRVERLDCDALVYPDGSVRCASGESCRGPRCLAECLGAKVSPGQV